MLSRLAALVAAGALVVTGLATGTAYATPAPDPSIPTATVTATPTPTPTPTVAHAVQCGRVTITVTKSASAVLALQYRVNGHRTVTVPITLETQVVPVTVREDSGVRFVWYRLASQDRWSQVRVESDCRPDWVRADAPTVVQPECGTTRGKLTIPADRGVRYEVNGRTWRSGSYDVRTGVYRVQAFARDGYRLVGDQRWRLTVERAAACPSPSPTPTVTPTVTVSPTPTVDPDPEAVTPAAPKLTQATCDDKTASISIPEVKGVVYKGGSGTVLESGKSYTANAGDATVTAEAADGYVLAEDVTAAWTFVVSETPACPTATPTVTNPVVVVNNIPVPGRIDTGLGGLARH